MPPGPVYYFCVVSVQTDNTQYLLVTDLMVYDTSLHSLGIPQQFVIDTFSTLPAFPNMATLAWNAEAASPWPTMPSFFVHYVKNNDCYLKAYHPINGEVPIPNPVDAGQCGTIPGPLMVVNPSGDTLNVVLAEQPSWDTVILRIWTFTSSSWSDLVLDTAVTSSGTFALSNGVGTPDPGVCLAYRTGSVDSLRIYSLRSGNVLSLEHPSGDLFNGFRTGDDDGGCWFRTLGGDFFRVRDNGGVPDSQTVSEPALAGYLSYPAVKDLPGNANGGTVWFTRLAPTGDTVFVQQWNLADLGSSAPLFADSFPVIGELSGTFSQSHVINDTLYTVFQAFGPEPPRFFSMDTTLNTILTFTLASVDTGFMGAPWVLFVNSSGTFLSLDRTTGSLRPGSWSLPGGQVLLNVDVQGDTLAVCHGNFGGAVHLTLLDLTTLTPLASVTSDSTLNAGVQCRMEGEWAYAVQGLSDGARVTALKVDGTTWAVDLNPGSGTDNLGLAAVGASGVAVLFQDPVNDSFYVERCDTLGNCASTPWQTDRGSRAVSNLVLGDSAIYVVLDRNDTTFVHLLDPANLAELRVDTLSPFVMGTHLVELGRWYALLSSGITPGQVWVDRTTGQVDTQFAYPIAPTGVHLVPESGSRFSLYVVGNTTGAPLYPRIVRFLVDTALTRVAEGTVRSYRIRPYLAPGGLLVAEGNARVNLEVYTLLGRRVFRFSGEVRGSRTVGRLPARGVYFLIWQEEDLPRTFRKRVVWVR